MFCKAGRHRSYALLIAFLMWAGHVHDHSVWTDLIAPLRKKALSHRGTEVELVFEEALSDHQRRQAYVPFGNVLLKFALYLNSKKGAHRWPTV